jgi:vacuolar-type H+-ATPase subunit H
MSGSGELNSESVQIVESKTFDRIKSVLKLNQSYTNIVKDIKATFIVNDGRLFVKPFDTKLGNIKLNVSGDQGIDRTINYLIMTEIPSADLGESANALMGAFSTQLAALGLNLTPPEIIKINLRLGGTFTDPVITPVFAGSAGRTVTSVAASVADTVKQEVVEKVNEAARQQADKILNEAEEKAQMLRDEAARSAGGIRSEADLRGKKLVKDAEAQGPLAVAAARRTAEVLNKEAEKRATQLVTEANGRADKILADAKAKAEELLK